MTVVEVDVWVRGTESATTHRLESIPSDPRMWADSDVRALLSEMLLALDRQKNPGGQPPAIVLRGFSWIVSPVDQSGVVLHVELVTGTVSAGPFAIEEARLTEMVERVMHQSERVESIH